MCQILLALLVLVNFQFYQHPCVNYIIFSITCASALTITIYKSACVKKYLHRRVNCFTKVDLRYIQQLTCSVIIVMAVAAILHSGSLYVYVCMYMNNSATD